MRMLYLEGMPIDEISALAVSLCGHLERAVLDATTTTAAGKRGKRNRQEQHRDASTSPIASALETVTPELWERIATGIADVYEGMSPTLEKQQQCRHHRTHTAVDPLAAPQRRPEDLGREESKQGRRPTLGLQSGHHTIFDEH